MVRVREEKAGKGRLEETISGGGTEEGGPIAASDLTASVPAGDGMAAPVGRPEKRS